MTDKDKSQNALGAVLRRELAQRRLLLETLDEIPRASQDERLIKRCHEVLRERRVRLRVVRYGACCAAACAVFLLLAQAWFAPKGSIHREPVNAAILAADPDWFPLVEPVMLTQTKPQMVEIRVANQNLSVREIRPTHPLMTEIQILQDEALLRFSQDDQLLVLVGYTPDAMSAMILERRP